MAQDSSVVIDHGQSRLSDLWKKEDYLAIWFGFGAEAWGVVLGMIVANSIGTPKWVLCLPGQERSVDPLAIGLSLVFPEITAKI